MGDMTPAEEAERGAACCRVFEPSMRNEARRLRTFRQWPGTSPVSARDLVKAGFFFVGPRDEVQCFCCGGVLKDWAPGDCPAAEHLKFFPYCRFICGEDVGNQEMLPLQEIFDTVDGQFLSLLQGIDSEETALPNEPEYPEMVTEEMRLSTFQNWPQYTDMHPEQLARAGFFYTGQDDVVRCFYCDGGVRNWSFGDDPWREHAKWYPGCEFLLRSKGREFVRSVHDLGFIFFSFFGKDESRMSTEEQLRRLQEERMCKVCMDRDVSVVFVPCGHLVACGDCALNLRLCPICRAVIRGSVRTFMS
ncbi:Baculoviral IAP repeat-containing protein 7-B [Leptosomus discolor]|uniref:RING-type E3 ubiquitin transferase n=1 Tax=Leptosomus discolor TaxID=188344 RepID=A0A091PGI2_LEPDC|nr:Baculoviral IAP repeat-containing protein 7-B [Leptosomus discolor]